MADDRQLFALMAPRVPAIWDVIGPAYLNPQLAVADGGKAESGFIAGVFERATTALGALGSAPTAPPQTSTPPTAG